MEAMIRQSHVRVQSLKGKVGARGGRRDTKWIGSDQGRMQGVEGRWKIADTGIAGTASWKCGVCHLTFTRDLH